MDGDECQSASTGAQPFGEAALGLYRPKAPCSWLRGNPPVDRGLWWPWLSNQESLACPLFLGGFSKQICPLRSVPQPGPGSVPVQRGLQIPPVRKNAGYGYKRKLIGGFPALPQREEATRLPSATPTPARSRAPRSGRRMGKLCWGNALCRSACYRAPWRTGGCIRCLRAFPLCNNLSLFFNVVVTLWLNQYLQFVSSPGCNKIVFQVLKHPIKVCKAVVLSLSHS